MTGALRIMAVALTAAGILGVTAGSGGAQQLVADLSKHLVAITTGFTGADVLLFGSIEDPQGDGNVVVVVRGPDRPVVVRHKERVAGIWINSQRLMFRGVPSFYSVAASKPLTEIVPDAVARRHQIGAENVRMVAASNGAGLDASEFKAAIIRNRIRTGLFGATVKPIRFLGHRLFSTTMHFPANVPTGTYSVQVLMLRKGQVVSAQTTPLVVSKVGASAEVFDFANRYAAAYGLIAIVIAVAAGWGAAQIFRRA